MLNRDIVQFVLASTKPAELVECALGLIARAGGHFSYEAGELLADYLAEASLAGAPHEEILRGLTETDSPLARLVAARLLAQLGHADQAIEAYSRTNQALAAPDEQVLSQRARLLFQRGRAAEASQDLRTALALFPPYSFFVKSEKLIEKILRGASSSAASAAAGEGEPPGQPRRRARVALLSSSTTALLAPVLRAAGFRCGVHLEIYEGVYGNYRQEILDPGSALYRFHPDFVLIIPNHRDLSPAVGGGREQSAQFCRDLRVLWQTLRGRQPCHIVQCGLDLPPEGAWGPLEFTLPEGRRRLIAAANLDLAEQLPDGVSFVDVSAVAAHAGQPWCSPGEWHSARQYPAAAVLPLFADYLLSHCLAVLGLSGKVLAVDLDNTLWGGVIGEDLLGGIRIGPPSAEGEAYLDLQKYLKELQQRGVLLAVCSKNNLADAELPFRQHDAMLLRLHDFAAFAANWDDKAANLQALAQELSLGLDSFVFLDDNPLERALVRARLPQVAVPECGQGPTAMLAALRRGLYFPSLRLTEEDLVRHASYQGNRLRRAAQTSAASLDDFLAGLEMVSTHGPVDAATLPRVAQLINKTNQFNLTTRRYTEEQLRTLSKSPQWWCRWFKLADRFGDHGLIGVMLAQRQAACWRIDTWLMSCRILGRQMEDFMFHVLQVAALQAGAAQIVGEYLPTEKNALVKDLYPRLGFQADRDESSRYIYTLAKTSGSEPRWIRGKALGDDCAVGP